MRKSLTVLLGSLVFFAIGCGDKNKQHGERGNADRTPTANIDGSPVDRVLQMPNYYNDVVRKCDGTTAVYVTSNKDNAPSNLWIVPNSRECAQ